MSWFAAQLRKYCVETSFLLLLYVCISFNNRAYGHVVCHFPCSAPFLPMQSQVGESRPPPVANGIFISARDLHKGAQTPEALVGLTAYRPLGRVILVFREECNEMAPLFLAYRPPLWSFLVEGVKPVAHMALLAGR